MIEGSIFYRNSFAECYFNQIQESWKANQDPLPERLDGISNIVLQVDTTCNDELEKLIIPTIPIEGRILYHNKSNVSYEDSSQLLFDHGHKFSNRNNPLIVTLQFKLGGDDNGSSMDDLLLKANLLNTLGHFKFKLYILKIVPLKQYDNFKMPPVIYLLKLNFIAFRFDTDILAKYTPTERDRRREYCNNVVSHPAIKIYWLSPGLEELHLGQKVRLKDLKVFDRLFPNLTYLGIETYDQATANNLSHLLQTHNQTIKEFFMRDYRLQITIPEMPVLDKITIVGYKYKFNDRLKKALSYAKEIHCYGTRFDFRKEIFGDFHRKHENIELYYSCDSSYSDLTHNGAERLATMYGIKVVEVPFLSQYQIGTHYFALYRFDYTRLGPAVFKYEHR